MLIIYLFNVILLCNGLMKSPIAKTETGFVIGTYENSFYGREYMSFKGIPYAEPPVGHLRFARPIPARKWSGVYNATQFSEPCIQLFTLNKTVQPPTGSEDCLYLNVFTPNLKGNYPVIAFIYGGGFIFGDSSSYGPGYLMDKDVVLVTMNHRLGPMGFLSTEDEIIPGNQGLRDQTLALQWIHDNIRVFGGNPYMVTLGGWSAGGVAAINHMLSPISRGKFHRCFSMSGTPLSAWSQQINPLDKTIKLAQYLKCPTVNKEVMVECLRSKSAQEIVSGQSVHFEWYLNAVSPFSPTVEFYNNIDPFIPDDPYILLKSGYSAKVPLLMGTTTEDGLVISGAFLYHYDWLNDLNVNYKNILHYYLHYGDTLPKHLRPKIAKQIINHYFGDNQINLETLDLLTQLTTDRDYASTIAETARLHATYGEQLAYHYVYSYRGNKSFASTISFSQENNGVSHGDDVIHLFDYEGLPLVTPEDVKMKDLMVDIYTSFAEGGSPNVFGVKWSPVKSNNEKINYVRIGGASDVVPKIGDDFGQMSFWISLGLKENENLLKYDD